MRQITTVLIAFTLAAQAADTPAVLRGYSQQAEVFDTLFPTPLERSLELIEPVKYKAKLEEPALPEDPTSNQKNEQLPTYNAFSIDGDVTGPVVYVNYGTPADYEQLAGQGFLSVLPSRPDLKIHIN